MERDQVPNSRLSSDHPTGLDKNALSSLCPVETENDENLSDFAQALMFEFLEIENENACATDVADGDSQAFEHSIAPADTGDIKVPERTSSSHSTRSQDSREKPTAAAVTEDTLIGNTLPIFGGFLNTAAENESDMFMPNVPNSCLEAFEKTLSSPPAVREDIADPVYPVPATAAPHALDVSLKRMSIISTDPQDCRDTIPPYRPTVYGTLSAAAENQFEMFSPEVAEMCSGSFNEMCSISPKDFGDFKVPGRTSSSYSITPQDSRTTFPVYPDPTTAAISTTPPLLGGALSPMAEKHMYMVTTGVTASHLEDFGNFSITAAVFDTDIDVPDVPESRPFSRQSIVPNLATITDDTLFHTTSPVFEELMSTAAEKKLDLFTPDMSDSCSEAFENTLRFPSPVTEDIRDFGVPERPFSRRSTRSQDSRPSSPIPTLATITDDTILCSSLPMFDGTEQKTDLVITGVTRNEFPAVAEICNEPFGEPCSISAAALDTGIDEVPETWSSSSHSIISQDNRTHSLAAISDDTTLSSTIPIYEGFFSSAENELRMFTPDEGDRYSEDFDDTPGITFDMEDIMDPGRPSYRISTGSQASITCSEPFYATITDEIPLGITQVQDNKTNVTVSPTHASAGLYSDTLPSITYDMEDIMDPGRPSSRSSTWSQAFATCSEPIYDTVTDDMALGFPPAMEMIMVQETRPSFSNSTRSQDSRTTSTASLAHATTVLYNDTLPSITFDMEDIMDPGRPSSRISTGSQASATCSEPIYDTVTDDMALGFTPAVEMIMVQETRPPSFNSTKSQDSRTNLAVSTTQATAGLYRNTPPGITYDMEDIMDPGRLSSSIFTGPQASITCSEPFYATITDDIVLGITPDVEMALVQETRPSSSSSQDSRTSSTAFLAHATTGLYSDTLPSITYRMEDIMDPRRLSSRFSTGSQATMNTASATCSDPAFATISDYCPDTVELYDDTLPAITFNMEDIMDPGRLSSIPASSEPVYATILDDMLADVLAGTSVKDMNVFSPVLEESCFETFKETCFISPGVSGVSEVSSSITDDMILGFSSAIMDAVAELNVNTLTEMSSEAFKETYSSSVNVLEVEVPETRLSSSHSARLEESKKMASLVCHIPPTAAINDDALPSISTPTVENLTDDETNMSSSHKLQDSSKIASPASSFDPTEAVKDTNLCCFAQALLDAFVTADTDLKMYVPVPTIAEILAPCSAEDKTHALQEKHPKKKQKSKTKH